MIKLSKFDLWELTDENLIIGIQQAHKKLLNNEPIIMFSNMDYGILIKMPVVINPEKLFDNYPYIKTLYLARSEQEYSFNEDDLKDCTTWKNLLILGNFFHFIYPDHAIKDSFIHKLFLKIFDDRSIHIDEINKIEEILNEAQKQNDYSLDNFLTYFLKGIDIESIMVVGDSISETSQDIVVIGKKTLDLIQEIAIIMRILNIDLKASDFIYTNDDFYILHLYDLDVFEKIDTIS